MSYYQFLSKKVKGGCPRFAIVGHFLVKVVDVYDGDTITVVFDPNMDLFKVKNQKLIKKNKKNKKYRFYEHKVRMYGYDSAEMRQPKNEPDRIELKKQAVKARDVLRDMVLDKMVLLEVLDDLKEKYGRLLGNVYLLEKEQLDELAKGKIPIIEVKNLDNINKFMVDHHYGKPYFGGHKS